MTFSGCKLSHVPIKTSPREPWQTSHRTPRKTPRIHKEKPRPVLHSKPHEKVPRPVKFYASGGGLLVAPINTPRLFQYSFRIVS